MRKVYVNGAFVAENEAKISIFDRGVLFADAVYEGIAVLDGKLIDFKGHIDRLERSCGEINMPYHVDHDALLSILRDLVARNHMEEGFIYLQVSRGSADRDFAFDNNKMTPSVIAFTQSQPLLKTPVADKGMSIITVEDQRWKRCDIKTVQLLYPSLAKMEALKAGADDAWFTSDRIVLEGTSNNAFIVTRDGVIVTRPTSNAILPGITRASVLRYAAESGATVEERAFTVDEAMNAKEAFITSARSFVLPVIKINDQVIGGGTPGEVAKRTREIYIEESFKRAV